MPFALVSDNQFYYLDFDFLHKPSLTYEVFCTMNYELKLNLRKFLYSKVLYYFIFRIEKDENKHWAEL